MTVDRDELRRMDTAQLDAIAEHPDETTRDELASLVAVARAARAADRRIADLETSLRGMTAAYDRAVEEKHAKDRRIAELEAAQGGVSKDLFSMVCGERDDALLRLSIATESNVGDRKRIAELEAGLREAVDALGVDGPMALRYRLEKSTELRKLLPSEET